MGNIVGSDHPLSGITVHSKGAINKQLQAIYKTFTDVLNIANNHHSLKREMQDPRAVYSRLKV